MTVTYQLQDHLRHPHLKFAYVDGHHHSDFGMHRHDFSELFLVASGQANHVVASHVYPLSKGDVFVINGNVEHAFKDVDKLEIINLMFESGTPFFETPSLRLLSGYQAMFKVEPIARQATEYQAKLTLNAEQLPVVERLIAEIRQEYRSGDAGFELMLTGLLQQLVITLARMYQQQSRELPKTTLALSRALIFIEQNFTSPGVNSQAIASAAFISQRQLERLFKQFLRTSPNLYLREMQLNFASQLLSENSGLSIQSVAEMCGFTDSNYFSKCFKQKFHLSPRQYLSRQN